MKDHIAILLATYNGEKFLEEQLKSLVSQTYTDFTVYISDDCSTDSTIQIIQKYCMMDARFVNMNNKHHFGNARDNFMSLLSYVESELYMFCDQDDVWVNDKIEKMLQVYNQECSKDMPSLVYCDMKVVDEQLFVLNKSFQDLFGFIPSKIFWEQYLYSNNISGCALLMNRALADLYRKNDKIINKKQLIMHDFFFASIAALFGEIIYLNEPLNLYRQHGNNSVGAHKPYSMNAIRHRLREGKHELINCSKQVEEICKLLEYKQCDGTKYELCKRFANFKTYRKKERIAVLRQIGAFKGSILHKLYLLIIS